RPDRSISDHHGVVTYFVGRYFMMALERTAWAPPSERPDHSLTWIFPTVDSPCTRTYPRSVCYSAGEIVMVRTRGCRDRLNRRAWLALSLVLCVPAALGAQGPDPHAALVAQRNAVEQELESAAIIDRSVMVTMRDGKRMLADVYRPKNASGKVPIVFVRTPYNFNWWDVKNGAPRDMSRELEAVKRGYAYVEINERGHFYSEGNYDILGPPRTDGYDEIKWMSSQPWSNGKVGLTGCS